MEKINKTIQIVAIATIINGCAAQTFNINGSTGETPTDQKSQHFFVSGIGQEKITDAAEICGGVENIVKVETQQTFVNGLLGVITFGIYTPRDAKVYCR